PATAAAPEPAPAATAPGSDTPALVSDLATPAPFWAKAEAERQARLERIRETAIEEPEPEPAASELLEPAIEFDEAFLWSAEVLAAQGRRPDQISAEEITWLNQLRKGLNKTRLGLVNQLKAIVGQGPLNQEAVDEIEALLLQADVGVEATDEIIGSLQAKLRQDALPPDEAISYLKSILRDMLDQPLAGAHNMTFVPDHDRLNVWLMTGVNGAGKTTTIGKLAHIAKKSDYRCLIAAADTFRAAAVEQVKAWGARSDVEVIANPGKNTDPAAVVYDAIAAAQSRGTELLLVDTAGRLQNKKNLMDELTKVRRIIDKKAPDAQVEALLVLDATLGQNGLRQAQVFSESVNLSGVVLTKLDGTAKGGVALAVVQQLGLPIRFIGAGETIEDLRPFSSYEFVEALLSG
ncbi:signal recognition particle-docking protein FtsY, partial [filamentous cyanobacterium CCP5]